MKSIKTLILTVIISMTVLIFLIVTVASNLQFFSISNQQIQNELVTQVEKETSILSSRIYNVGKISEFIAKTIESMPQYDDNMVFSLVEKHLSSESLLFGAGFWFEPYVRDANKKYYGPYIYKDEKNSPILTWDYSKEGYDYFQYDWYKCGFGTDKNLVYGKTPFYDELLNTTLLNCTAPIRKGGKTIGVATTDITLKEIRDYVQKIKVGEKGYAFIVTYDGYYWGKAKEPKEDLKEKITEDKNAGMQKLGKDVVKSVKPGFMDLSGRNELAVYSPIGDTGLKLVLVYPKSEATQQLNKVLTYNIVIFVAGIAFFIVLLLIVVRYILEIPLERLKKKAQKVSEGDLSGDNLLDAVSKSNNEIGVLARVFNSMVENTRGLVLEISQTLSVLSSASEKMNASCKNTFSESESMSTASEDLAKGAYEQAEITEKGNTMVKDVVDDLTTLVTNTENNRQTVMKAEDAMQNGMSVILHQKQQMNESKQALVNVGNAIGNLMENSKRIGEIIDVINGITSQTNLLSLNAAIEASRAGEHGKGFAVVADEVRKLAVQSQQATATIEQLIKEIRSGVTLVDTEMRRTSSTIEHQENTVKETGESFESIMEAMDSIKSNIHQTFNVVNLLNGKSEKVSDLFQDLASISEEYAASTEQVSASSENQRSSVKNIAEQADRLLSMSTELRNAINKFKL